MRRAMQGWVRNAGLIGFRNHLLVVPLAACVSTIAEKITDVVEGAVSVPHTLGCGQLGRDLELLALQLERFATHPNVGAVLFVHMNCEGLRPYRIPEKAAAAGKLVEELNFHKLGGTTETVSRGAHIATRLLETLPAMKREPVPMSALILGTQCGSSDADSFRYAHPALGAACDRLVDEGATVVLTENFELIGGVDELAGRSVNALVAQKLREAIDRVQREARDIGYDGAAFTPPAAPEARERRRLRSLGHAAKAGTRPIQNVFALGEHITGPGLVVMDGPNNDIDSVSGLALGGCNLIAFTTGMGTPLGCGLAPVVKISSNHATAQQMSENIDVNAGPVSGVPYDIPSAADRIYNMILDCANGTLCAAERAGHNEISLIRYGCTF